MEWLIYIVCFIALIVSLLTRDNFSDLQRQIDILREEMGRFQSRLDKLTASERVDTQEKATESPEEVLDEVVAQEEKSLLLDAVVADETIKELEENFACSEPDKEPEKEPETHAAKSASDEQFRPPANDFFDKCGAKIKEWWQRYGPQYSEGVAEEVVLMRWWLPRIGGALALLTLLFLGLYMSQFTTPWMRACELIGVSVAFCGGGLFFEKRQKSFGGVLFVTGLVMLYLTSYAIYAFPAVRIIESPVAGATVQFGSMALIAFAGFYRKNNGLICLGYAFGVLVLLFMQYEMLPGGAMFMGLVLSTSAFLLWAMHKRFSFLVYIAQVVLLIIQVSTLGFFFLREQTVPNYLCLITVFGATLLVPALSQLVRFRTIPYANYLVLFCKASGAGLGYVVLRTMFPDSLLLFYGVLALSFIALGLLCFVRYGFNQLAQWYLISSSLFTALWVVNYFVEDVRCYALILESVVIALINCRNRTWLNETMMYCLWLYSTVLMTASLIEFSSSDVWSLVQSYIYMLYPVLQISVPMIAYGREPKWKIYSTIASGFVGALSGIFFIVMASEVIPSYNAYEILWLIGAAYFFGVMVLLPKLNRVAPISASVFLYFCSLFCYCSFLDFVWVLLLIWGWAILSNYANSCREKHIKLWNYLSYGGGIIVTLYTCHTLCFSNSNALFFSSVLALVFLGLSRIKLLEPLALLSVMFPLLTLVFNFGDVYMGRPSLGLSGMLFHMGAIVLTAVWLLWAKTKSVYNTIELSLGKLSDEWLLFPLVYIGSLFYITPMDWPHWWVLQVFTFISLLGLVYLGRKTKDVQFLLPFFMVAVLQVMSAQVYTWMYTAFDAIPAAHFFAVEFIYVAFYFALGLYVKKLKLSKKLDIGFMQSVFAAFAYSIGVAIIVYPTLKLMTLYTPLFALLSVVFVVVGVARNIKSYRFLGLITLILPGYRLFAYDITDALYRILAFGVGALLLIFIGYLYHRMVITTDKGEGEEDES